MIAPLLATTFAYALAAPMLEFEVTLEGNGAFPMPLGSGELKVDMAFRYEVIQSPQPNTPGRVRFELVSARTVWRGGVLSAADNLIRTSLAPREFDVDYRGRIEPLVFQPGPLGLAALLRSLPELVLTPVERHGETLRVAGHAAQPALPGSTVFAVPDFPEPGLVLRTAIDWNETVGSYETLYLDGQARLVADPASEPLRLKVQSIRTHPAVRSPAPLEPASRWPDWIRAPVRWGSDRIAELRGLILMLEIGLRTYLGPNYDPSALINGLRRRLGLGG